MTTINKYSTIPLYCQIKAIILEKIESGAFEADSKIPSEQDLCDQYDISRPTVRQAINELTANGQLYKQKGKGTFVSRQKSTIHIKDYSGFTDSIIDSKNPSAITFVSLEKIYAMEFPKLNEVFQQKTDSNSEYAKITFITRNQDEIIAVNVSYIPLSLFPEIISDLENKKPSIEILKGKYPLLPYHAKSTLDIIYTDQEEASILQLQPGQPLIRINNVLYARDNKAVEFIITKYRADKCRFLFENHK